MGVDEISFSDFALLHDLPIAAIKQMGTVNGWRWRWGWALVELEPPEGWDIFTMTAVTHFQMAFVTGPRRIVLGWVRSRDGQR